MAHRITIPKIENNTTKNYISAEAKYQQYKEQWYFHKSSWYRRTSGEGYYDGKGCNQFTGCVPECKFFKRFGRLMESEGFD
ncbi:MAG: hypothetical protein ACE5SW_09675 [Nitrososphaeraceae archaeon]